VKAEKIGILRDQHTASVSRELELILIIRAHEAHVCQAGYIDGTPPQSCGDTGRDVLVQMEPDAQRSGGFFEGRAM
jgi:hypothetical protein